jgi:hypothetical protein
MMRLSKLFQREHRTRSVDVVEEKVGGGCCRWSIVLLSDVDRCFLRLEDLSLRKRGPELKEKSPEQPQ